MYRRAVPPSSGGDAGALETRFKVETVNISEGGMMICFDPEITMGDVVSMTFLHPESKAELGFEVLIQWMRRNATDLMGRYCAGVSFKAGQEEGVKPLMSYAASINPEPVS